MHSDRSKYERRRHPRLEFEGRTVLFHRGTRVGDYEIHNLSAGGAFVTGAERIAHGHLIHALISLPTGESPLSISAAVHEVRKEHGSRTELALTFPCLRPDQEDRIHDALLRELIRERHEPSAPFLIYEPHNRVRAELENELRSFGVATVCVSTLEDTVRIIEDGEQEWSGLLVHSATTNAQALQVITFLAKSEHIPIVIIPDPYNSQACALEPLARLTNVRWVSHWNRDALESTIKSLPHYLS